MSDVRTMAHVDKFSHLTVPMLWFEIGLKELPDRLERRFGLYLNFLPTFQQVAMYGALAIGMLFSVYSVTQVALRTSKSLTTQRCHQKFNKNLANNSVYNPCEEKLIDLKPTKGKSQIVAVDELNKSDDEFESLNVITRDQYELEDDDALSDIEYTESNSDNSSSTSVSVIKKTFFSCSPFFFMGQKNLFRNQMRLLESLNAL
jgi:scavenger receptor class B, member 1